MPKAKDTLKAPTSARSQPTGFWIVGAAYMLVMAGGTTPIPLWRTWSRTVGFGPFITTLAFAVYAMGTVIALVCFSTASDGVGRRPVLAIGLLLSLASSLLLLNVSDIEMIFAARFLGGLGAGLATSAASAALVELAGDVHPKRGPLVATFSNVGGLGLGILVAATAVRVGAQNLSTIRVLYICLAAVTVVVVGLLPRVRETVTDASWHRFTWAVRRPTLPSSAPDRPAFIWAAAAVFVSFAVSGLFSSLVPGSLREDVGITDPLTAGLVVAALFIAALVAQVSAPRRIRRTQWCGSALLAGGTAAYTVGLVLATFPLFLAGTLIAGAGFGLTFRRGLEVSQRVAHPNNRADQLATYFLAAYLGNVVPTLGLGVVSQVAGDNVAAISIAALIVLGALVTGAEA